MAAMSLRISAQNSNPSTSNLLYRTSLNNYSSRATFPVKTGRKRFDSIRASGLNTSTSTAAFDVVVVGAGIIGLTIARQFLQESDLSVAVVDAAVPCSGATGAGQGYIWLIHKARGDKWELAVRSRQLWETFAESIQDEGMNPLDVLGWKKTGSLLVGKTPASSIMLKEKVRQLSEAGIKAEFLSSKELLVEEPALVLGKEGGQPLFLMTINWMLNVRLRTLRRFLRANRRFATEGRYKEYYYEPVTCLLRSGSSGEVQAVQTSKNTLYSKKAVVIATGCWTGSLVQGLLRDSDIQVAVPVQPRKGHLLVLENLNTFQLNHGLMEVGYVNHQAAKLQSTFSDSGPVNHAETSSVSMTATTDASGNLVLGSSRQLVGFSTDIDESIINRIWERAGEFFPTLRELSLSDLSKSREVRIGLRPYMPDGKPVIGPVPRLSNVFVAAGHEGEGLALALGTAETVVDMVLGNPGKVDCSPFALEGR
ncbi:hypothetical protein RJ639_018330 [Escallonia herrerae]|uniref:FAD-dependent oxidoreductase domain-containing protein 1 n=1 Tax=Escallonia herrerae TaxID=1293975 RepID=A0AA88V8K6_9ASTE|nr:hypothetical protein RJ639_018330 [Escallonia herrerae]